MRPETAPLIRDTDSVRVLTTTAGRLDVRVRSASGGWIRLHSVHAPELEARSLVERSLKGREVPAVAAVFGAGLGYIVDELLARRNDVRIIAFEVLPEVVQLWRQRIDLSALLASGQLVIATGAKFEMPAVSWPASVLASELLSILHPALAHHWPDAMDLARRVLAQFLYEKRANEEARQRLAPIYLDHTLRNLPALLDASDVRALEGIAAGDPLVLCGAGPSLERLLPALRANRHRAWYVALDTAVHPLLAAGIVPDLVVSIDPTPLNGRHLLNLPTRKRPWLVAETSVDPRALAAFHGRTFACRINRADPWPWLEQLGIVPATMRAWGSVLTTACDLITRMRPASVAFAAIDLAYTNGQPYCRGTVFEEDWEAQRLRDELPSVEAVWRARLASQTVEEPDITGERTHTAAHMIAFRNWARALVASTPACAFANVTGAGILHGEGIAQEELGPWLDRANARVARPEDRLAAAASRPWRNRAEAVAQAAAEATNAQGEPWQEWHARVPRVDRPALGRVLAHAARRVRGSKGAGDMTTGQSDWIDVPFDASNFSAHGAMQWQVDEGGVGTYAYRLDGKTMMLSFKINHSTVKGKPERELHLRLPGSHIAARGAANAVWIGTQPAKEMGYATVHPGHDFIAVHRSNEEPFPMEEGYFFLFGQLVIEVQ